MIFRLFVILVPQELSFLREGIVYIRFTSNKPLNFLIILPVINSIISSTGSLPLSPKTTVEDVLNFTKTEIQNYLRLNYLKISGSKLTLAKRVVDSIHSRCDQNKSTEQLAAEEHVGVSPFLCADNVPNISDLKSGWSGESCSYPKVTINDIEKYLLYSSHRTEDSGKMQCYRQYIRGLNFYKEGYIHKIMINEISDTCQMCYIRSKCYPSMHKGVYEQWLLVSKEEPFQVVKANCTCPAG